MEAVQRLPACTLATAPSVAAPVQRRGCRRVAAGAHAEPKGRALSSEGLLGSAVQPSMQRGRARRTWTAGAMEEGSAAGVTTAAPEAAETPAAESGAGSAGAGEVKAAPMAFPLPGFMAEQMALEQGGGAGAAEEAPAAPRARKAPPKKLAASDKATAPWGWGGKGSGKERPMGELQAWLSARGLPAQTMALDIVREGGRGLVATADVGKGEKVLFVPEAVMMTPQQIYEDKLVGPLLLSAAVPEWPALAIHLLLEAGKGEQSRWNTYIATLPQNPPCILQWSAEEVDVLLKGSPVQRKAIECISDVTSTFRDLDAVLFSKHRDIFPEELFSLGLFKWAFACLFSRLVRLPSLNNQLALVPWADMLNHRCEVEATLDFDTWKKAVVLQTDRPFRSGTEVFVSYGPKSNGALLLAYGVVPNTRNPHDSVDITLGLDPKDPLLAAKQAAAKRAGLPLPVSYPLQMEGWPSRLLAFLRLAAITDEATPQQVLDKLAEQAADKEAGLSSFMQKGSSFGSDSQPLDVEIGAREALVASCQVALSGYQTTLQEDEAVLAGVLDDYLEDDGEQRIRVLAAAALRASERRILLKTDFIARTELRELRALAGVKGGKAKIDLGNNMGGDRGVTNPLQRLLNKIARP